MIDQMPPNIAVIRDAAIDHALHGTPLPQILTSYTSGWLFTKSMEVMS